MKVEIAQKWQELCHQAATEQDPIRLLQLVTEINRLLLEKEERLLRQEQEAKEHKVGKAA